MSDMVTLQDLLDQATGADAALDQAVAAVFAVPPAHFSGSIDACRTLVAAVLPGWKLHLGFGISGIFPYARLSCGNSMTEAEAGAVPLAILRALVRAKSIQ